MQFHRTPLGLWSGLGMQFLMFLLYNIPLWKKKSSDADSFLCIAIFRPGFLEIAMWLTQ